MQNCKECGQEITLKYWDELITFRKLLICAYKEVIKSYNIENFFYANIYDLMKELKKLDAYKSFGFKKFHSFFNSVIAISLKSGCPITVNNTVHSIDSRKRFSFNCIPYINIIMKNN